MRNTGHRAPANLPPRNVINFQTVRLAHVLYVLGTGLGANVGTRGDVLRLLERGR